MLENDAAGVRFSTWEQIRYSDLLIRLEQRLKFLFVPAAPCEEHKWVVERGRKAGMTNRVLLDKEKGRMDWVERARCAA